MTFIQELKELKLRDKLVILILSFLLTFVAGMIVGNTLATHQLIKIFMTNSENQKSLNINTTNK